MKNPHFLILLLIVCLLLNGCSFYFTFNLPPQEVQAEPLPIGSNVDANLTAKDIYNRVVFEVGERAFQYTTEATIGMGFMDGDTVYPSNFHYDTQVLLSPEDCAVNVFTSLYFDGEDPECYWDYYREENGMLICYSHNNITEESYREQIELDGMAPYAIITDYSTKGYPLAPKELLLDPQTRILNDREVFLLTVTESALYAFGSTGNTGADQQLDQRDIVNTWYVDTETFLPVQQEYYLSQVDDLLGQIIDSVYALSISEVNATIDTYAFTLKDLTYTPVQVPDIPVEVQKEAWNNAGFSDT